MSFDKAISVKSAAQANGYQAKLRSAHIRDKITASKAKGMWMVASGKPQTDIVDHTRSRRNDMTCAVALEHGSSSIVL